MLVRGLGIEDPPRTFWEVETSFLTGMFPTHDFRDTWRLAPSVRNLDSTSATAEKQNVKTASTTFCMIGCDVLSDVPCGACTTPEVGAQAPSKTHWLAMEVAGRGPGL